ncbi:MAG: PDZ domain-containing protein [Planctomycetota bacterium]
MLRDPDVGPENIAFVHADDIWLVGREGGNAIRITAGEGRESDPVFSPDGKYIAFTGQYGGNSDVYVVEAGGGEPVQLTWHPGEDVVQGWTADGKIMFRSGRNGQPTRLWQFFTVPVEGGLPQPLAVPQSYHGEMSADGQWLAYQEIGLWDPEWRNYRGGQAQPVSIVSTSSYDRITPPWEGERHLAPVWLDGVVYYLSERDYAANVWSFNPANQEHRQHTTHADFDVKSIGAGHGVVVYEQAGYLHELNPATGEQRQLEVNIARDMNQARPRWEDVEAGDLRDARLSPTGKRAIMESRGDLFTVPLDKGSWRNITRKSGIADRHAVWSPDGTQIAWFNDDGDEYGLVIADQNGNNQRRIEFEKPGFYFVPTWSPDGKKLAFTDVDYRVLVLDIESEELTHIDTDRFAHPERSMNPVWSPDSNWIAYSRRLENQLRVIKVHNLETGDTHDLTDGMADSISPVWDESGKYLYFLASTDYGLNTGWLDMTSYDRPVTYSMYVALLSADEKSPFLPQSDEEEGDDEEDEESESDEEGNDEEDNDEEDSDGDDSDEEEQAEGESEEDGDEESSSESAGDEENGDEEDGDGADEDGDADGNADEDGVKVVIDFDGIASRIVDVPGVSRGEYVALANAPKGKVFVLENVEGSPGLTVQRYSLEDREAKEFATGVSYFTVSNDRKTVLMRTGGSWKGAGANGSGDGESLSISGMRVKVDPRAEWRQMLRDGWRFMRDFLYVDNAHGADWEAVWEWYSPWLEDVNHRSDFNHLLDILSGEVAVGHSYVRGGDFPDLTSPQTGLPGADLEESLGHYRISRIYNGGNWNPGLQGPLSIPGIGVSEGDYILAVDGVELKAPTNPYQLFEGTAGRTISIMVNDEPSMDGAEEVFIVPTRSENQLRTWAWVDANQKRVDEMSGGKLAYVWLPNTGRGGYTYFNRMYFAQQDRQGAVIDERNNGGGSAADYIIEVLDRELTGYFNSRAGDRRPFTQPMAGLFGPKVMVINERAGSGGDLLPYLFRFKEIGPLVGRKTWGGLVGTWDTPPLIDGGRFVAPRGGFIDVDGNWAVEGEGVAPDIEVRNNPAEVIAGGDPQLERAIEEAMKLLETEAVEFKPEPAPPIRARRPGDDN